jgi:FkbH-like protein
MNELFKKCLLVSDFNISNLAGYLRNESELDGLEVDVAPFGQVLPTLTQEDSPLRQNHPDFVVVWTRPEAIIGSFQRTLQCSHAPLSEVLTEVDRFTSCLLSIRQLVKFTFVPTWVLPAHHHGLGMLDMRKDIGLARTLMQMNLRLAENLEQASNFFVLDAQKWMSAAGKSAFSPKLWYMGKIPFSHEVFKEAAKNIASGVNGLAGKSRKLVLVDLDDTLWGGIVGDVGWKNIRLGGHDFAGEAFADFQRELKALTNRGVLLGIVSKNQEAVALEAIREHPEMVLKLDDFAGWKINWEDKAQNIADLVAELNLGLQSVVFIDDNPIERARVREALPEVLVPDWPEDCMLYKSAFLGLRCFDVPALSQEDLQRTRMYVSDRARGELKKKVGDINDWLKRLGLTVKVEELNEANLQRAVQLLNKTNQMNLSTRRMTDSELLAWTNQSGRKLWTFRVSDRFGDSGLTGILSLGIENSVARIVDFILSCRVMGRNVEQTMLHIAVQHARTAGITEILAEYKPTPKNKPCAEFFKKSGFANRHSANLFHWDARREYPAPAHIYLKPA